MRLGASYQIKKITPWIEVNFMGSRWAAKEQEWINPWLVTANSQSPYYKLDKYFDINLGAEYRIDKQLSGFIRVTNLLNKQYFRYDGYPVAGLEIMVGIRYRF